MVIRKQTAKKTSPRKPRGTSNTTAKVSGGGIPKTPKKLTTKQIKELQDIFFELGGNIEKDGSAIAIEIYERRIEFLSQEEFDKWSAEHLVNMKSAFEGDMAEGWLNQHFPPSDLVGYDDMDEEDQQEDGGIQVTGEEIKEYERTEEDPEQDSEEVTIIGDSRYGRIELAGVPKTVLEGLNQDSNDIEEVADYLHNEQPETNDDNSLKAKITTPLNVEQVAKQDASPILSRPTVLMFNSPLLTNVSKEGITQEGITAMALKGVSRAELCHTLSLNGALDDRGLALELAKQGLGLSVDHEISGKNIYRPVWGFLKPKEPVTR